MSLREKKKDFFEKVISPESFNFNNYNLLTTGLEGFYHEYSFNNLTITSLLKLLLKGVIKNLRGRQNRKIRSENYIYLFGGNLRLNKDNKTNRYYSIYYENIISYLGKEKSIILTKNDNEFRNLIASNQNCLPYNLFFNNPKITLRDILFYINLLGTFKKIKSKNDFTKTEIKWINSSLYLFFRDYLATKLILDIIKIKKYYTISAFYQSGINYALKEKKIPIFELQNGLIFETHYCLIYPPSIEKVKKKLLTSDYFLAVSDFWAKIVSRGVEYDDYQIRNIGFFQHIPENYKFERKAEIMILFVSVGVDKHKQMAQLKWLVNNFSKLDTYNFQIIYKPHPGWEYSEEAINNLNSYIDFFELSQQNIYTLIQNCDFIISPYSSVLFEAGYFRKKAFSIILDEDYSENAKRISVFSNQTIPSIYNLDEIIKSSQDSNYEIVEFYSNFNPSVL